ncbi:MULTISPECIES: hypothetical protein [Methylomicrobium]|uniref:Uncharacterized protein n=1 Tax=Methylomicrobium album BG8 TaxID=686340 RepID=H8GNR4_METAL|nr:MULTISPECIES: hypothetical protein [Methylomicrobium]EIC30820.1 hypothetical protein Metal_3146 [Methylomicrobium album BG8]
MFVFILLSLALGYFVQTSNPLLSQLVSPLALYLGIGGALLAVSGMLFRKRHFTVWYDLFASSVLLAWFAYWKTQFQDDSPMFFFFPVYFAAMTAFISLAFIGPCERLDNETVGYMRRLVGHKALQPWAIMLGTLGSLELLDHYLVFPIAVTLLLLRFALDCCVERNSRKGGKS